ncbi:MAG: Hsp20/alpha crystallin family protein [Bacilli bacterium]|nr:Hsp20/alpha crystallin family protein [Bacilli bacterium]
MMMIPRSNFDLFDDIFGDSFFKKEDKMMKTDIRETDNGYIIDVDLPGYKKENIKIDVTDGYLTINAKMNQKNTEDNNGKYVRRERFFGECSRSFYVGEAVEDLDIKAKFQNGILSLEIPKIDERKNLPEKKYIEISD